MMKTIKTSCKNKQAEVYYRLALSKEFNNFITHTINVIKKEYEVVKTPIINNSINSLVFTIEEVEKKLLNILEGNTKKIVNKWINKTYKTQKEFFKEQTKLITLSNIKDKQVLDTLKIISKNNVGLIKNVASQTITNINNIVYQASTTGQGWYDIQNNLKEQNNLSNKRINIIARDQTVKTTQAINRLQQLAAGIEYYIWETAGDERVSTGIGGHKQLNKRMFKLEEDNKERVPIIDAKGNRGNPSERPLCRCTSIAVIPNDDYKIVWDNKNNNYKEIK